MTTIYLDAEPLSDDALRERSAGLLERALAFVDRWGDALARTRARVMLQAEPTSALEPFLAAVEADGESFGTLGLPACGTLGLERRSAFGGVDWFGAFESLCVLADASLLPSERCARTCDFVSSHQLGDGSWGREIDDPSTRLFATGLIAGLLARSPYARPALFSAADSFFAEAWTPPAMVDADVSVLLGSTVFFANVRTERSEAALSWCSREVQRRLGDGTLSAVAAGRILAYCDVTALPGAELDTARLLARLLTEQAEDGGFRHCPDENPREPLRVGATLDAIAGALLLCRAL